MCAARAGRPLHCCVFACSQPWNIGHALAGDVEKKMDPYFPFEDAVDVWARTVGVQSVRGVQDVRSRGLRCHSTP